MPPTGYCKPMRTNLLLHSLCSETIAIVHYRIKNLLISFVRLELRSYPVVKKHSRLCQSWHGFHAAEEETEQSLIIQRQSGWQTAQTMDIEFEIPFVLVI